MKRLLLTLALIAGLVVPSSAQALTLNAGTIISSGTVSGTAVNGLNQFSFNTTVNYAVYKETASGTLDFLYQVTNNGPAGADTIDHVSSASFKNVTTTVDTVTTANAALTGAGFTIGGATVAPTSTSLTSNNSVANWNFNNAIPVNGESGVLVALTNATSFTLGSTSVSNSGSVNLVTVAPTPEPASFVLLGGCFVGLGLGYVMRRRRTVSATTI